MIDYKDESVRYAIAGAGGANAEKARLYIAGQRGKLRLAEIKAQEIALKSAEKDDVAKKIASELVAETIALAVARLDDIMPVFEV